MTFPQAHIDLKIFSQFFLYFYIKMNTSQGYLHSKYKKKLNTTHPNGQWQHRLVSPLDICHSIK
jgi:hypothetical protein